MNSCDDFHRTVESVKSQKSSEIQYIVIDGKSTDGTVDEAQKYGHLIDIFISEPDSGIYDAMNKGVSLANGKFILFLNAGDILCEDGIKSLISSACLSADLICHTVNLTMNGIKIGEYLPTSPPSVPDYQHMYWPHPGILARKKLFLSVGNFNERFRCAGDLDWANRVIKAGSNYVIVDSYPVVSFDLKGVSSSLLSLREAREVAILHGKSIISAYFRYFKSALKRIVFAN